MNYVQLNKCTVIAKYRDLETRVRGHSRSLEMTSFDRSHMNSY